MSGKWLVKFSSISNVVDKAALECSAPLASIVGKAICCPQVSSLLHKFQGNYSSYLELLVLHKAAANDCFTDITSILVSRGANSTVPALCSVKSSNLTGGSCPVKNIESFEKTVNRTILLDACSTVDPLKECCRPVCQPAIMDAALYISSRGSSLVESANPGGRSSKVVILSDCKGVVCAWF